MSFRVSRRVSLIAFAAVLIPVLGAAAPAARGDLLGLGAITGSNCSSQQVSQPFWPWQDPNSYYRVPGGTFEWGLPGWSTTAGAGVTAGNEPWFVSGFGGHSLSLPPASSATSPPTCVSAVSPTLRFFARSSGASSGSSLTVEVLFQNTLGILSSLPIGSVSASGNWTPTPVYLVVANALSVLGGGYGNVAFRFTSQGNATWQIDDVYVDPWRKG